MSRPSHSGRAGRPRTPISRDQFLDTAVTLFGQQGVAGTTLGHIARALGVTPAMVHYHFANRDQLLDAVVAERLKPFLDAIWAPMLVTPMPHPVTVLQQTASCILDQVLALPWLPALWLSDLGSTASELRDKAMQDMPIAQIMLLTDAIKQAQANGELNPHLQPHMIFMTLVGVILVPFSSLEQCRLIHPDADFSTQALRRHVDNAVALLLKP